MRIPALIALAACCGLLPGSPALAQTTEIPDHYCRDEYFPRQGPHYRRATIKGAVGEKAHLHADEPAKCPDDPACRSKDDFFKTGDRLFVSRTRGKFACVWHQQRQGNGTMAWIEADRLAFVADPKPPAERDWFGEWRNNSDLIRIAKSRTAGELDISGEASIASRLGSHTGTLRHTARPAGGSIRFTDAPGGDNCEVSLELVGRFLLVNESLKCRERKTSFSGIYAKKR